MEPPEFPFNDAYFKICEKMRESVYVVETLRDKRGEIADLRIKYANPSSQAHANVLQKKLIGKRFSWVFGTEITVSYIKLINKIYVTGEGSKDEIYYPKLDKYFSISVFSFKENLYMVISTDISREKNIEKELEEEENFLKSIFEAFPGVIWVYDLLKKEDVYICREIYELVGYTKDDMERNGPSFLKNLYHPKDLPKVEGLMNKIKKARNGEVIEIKYRLMHKNDGWHWFDAKHVILKRTPEGEPRQFLGIVEDITQHKRTEEVLRFSERTFKTLAEHSPDIIIRFNHNLQITYVNRVFPHLIGKTREECVGKRLQDLGAPYDISSSEKLLKIVLETGEPQTLEFDMETEEGLKYYSARIIPEFEKHHVETALFVAHDITDIKQAEEEILRLANIVECSEDAIIGKTVDGIIFSWNKGAEEIYGYSADEVIGKHISILMNLEEWEKTSKIMEKIKKGETITHFEAKRIRKDGKEIYVSLTLSPIKNTAGEITGISTIAREITERKQHKKS